MLLGTNKFPSYYYYPTRVVTLSLASVESPCEATPFCYTWSDPTLMNPQGIAAFGNVFVVTDARWPMVHVIR